MGLVRTVPTEATVLQNSKDLNKLINWFKFKLHDLTQGLKHKKMVDISALQNNLEKKS